MAQDKTLKGLHIIRTKTSTGQIRTYYYAWRGGPRLQEEFGTIEFLRAFQHHHSLRQPDVLQEQEDDLRFAGTLQHLLNQYQKSPAFLSRSQTTQVGYIQRIHKIEAKFGTLPIKALDDPRIRGIFLNWRNDIASQIHQASNGRRPGTREADYCIQTLSVVISWAHNLRLIQSNQLLAPGRLDTGTRIDSVWADAEFEALRTKAKAHVMLPALIARETGQRQADILALTWDRYDGAALYLIQSKGNVAVGIPVTTELKSVLDTEPRTSSHICLTSQGTPWTRDGFRSSFGKAQIAAGVAHRTFHDFRGTAVTKLAEAGCSVPEIGTITGHSLRSVETILQRHYLSRSRVLADSAIAKLDRLKDSKSMVQNLQ